MTHMQEKERQYLQTVAGDMPYVAVTQSEFRFNEDPASDFVLINGEWMFKFSKYDWTVALLDNEAAAAAFLRGQLYVPVPDLQPIRKGALKYRLPEGKPLLRQKLMLMSQKQQKMIAAQLGCLLSDLADAPLRAAKNAGLNNSPAQRSREEWLDEYALIRQKVYPYCDSCTKESIELAFRTLTENEDFPAYKPAVVHAGLAAKNILYDEKAGRIVLITGFERTGLGDPALDIAALLNEYGESFVRQIDRYCRIGEETMKRARFYAFAEYIDWCKRTADMITTRDFTHFGFYLKDGCAPQILSARIDSNIPSKNPESRVL